MPASQDRVIVKCHVVSDLLSLKQPRDTPSLFRLPCIRDKQPIADPELGGPLDLLLGIADCVRCSCGPPDVDIEEATVATPTIFGWTLGGAIPEKVVRTFICHARAVEDQLEQSLQQIWAQDKTPDDSSSHLSAAEKSAIDCFRETCQVLPDERYQVQLPRREDPPVLGLSRPAAKRRFLQNERSLKSKGKLEEFEGILKEYLELEHAEEVPQSELSATQSSVYYLPVHGVVKERSTTTKFRAVFDASAKTSSGVSLNDQLLSGPNLYPMLTSVLTSIESPLPPT